MQQRGGVSRFVVVDFSVRRRDVGPRAALYNCPSRYDRTCRTCAKSAAPSAAVHESPLVTEEREGKERGLFLSFRRAAPLFAG